MGILAAVALTTAALTACGSSTKPTGSTPRSGGKLANGKTFTVALRSDPGNLDPDITTLGVAISVDRYLYDPLINLDDKGQPIAGLAQQWSADTTRASFTLRPGITCADGSPLTASDVAANINFVADPKSQSPLTGLYVMPGTKATGDDATRAVTVLSAVPDSFLLVNVGNGLGIACRKGLQDRKTLTEGENGTGMFAISERVANDHYTLTRRPNYTWGPGNWQPDQAGLPDKVVIKIVQSETTAMNLLLSGGLNAALINGADQQRGYARNLFHADTQALIGELFYNEAGGHPGQDPVVRKALTQALDLDQVGKVLTSGTGKKATGAIRETPNPCTGDTVAGNLVGHDLDAAKATLDAAGWTAAGDGVRSKDGKRLTVALVYATQNGPDGASAAELVQQVWKGLGVDVSIKGLDTPGVNQTLMGTGSWDVSMGQLGFAVPNQLVPFVSGATPPQGTNFAHIHNQDYQAKVQQAAAQPGAQGCPLWEQAEESLIKAVDLVPYYDTVTPTFGVKATFTISQDSITPGSIRMLA